MLEKQKQQFARMNQDERVKFLARLAYHASEVARGSYPEAGVEDKEALACLKGYNEVVQVLAKQLLAAIRVWEAEEAYPNDVFFDILMGKATPGQCQWDLLWAMNTTLEEMGFVVE